MSNATLAPRVGKTADILRILIVDDNEPDVVSLARLLRKRFGSATEIHEADDAATALELLSGRSIDLVLIDYRLPDMDGLNLLSAVRDLRLPLAAVLMTGQGNETIAAEAIKRGAHDYLAKRDIAGPELERIVSAAVQTVRRKTRRKQRGRQRQKLYFEMEHLVRSLSHDMSANFMVLESTFNELKQAQPAQPQMADGMSHVEACLRESKRFLDDLTLLAKTGGVDMSPARVDLSAAIREVLFELEPLVAERDIELVVEPAWPAVWCHEGRLKQVLSNLVRNAIRHGCDPKRPCITIARPEGEPASPPGNWVWLRIRDNGPGIPAESREAIFLAGHRLPSAHPSGSGMGLAIVQKIVEHYRGEIFVDPACTQGTAFVLRLPAK